MLIPFTITECEQFERYNCVMINQDSCFNDVQLLLIIFRKYYQLVNKKNCLLKIQSHLNIKSNALQTIRD